MFRLDKNYHIFISHSWSYSSHYETVKKWIDSSNITVSDYSIPENKSFSPMRENDLKRELLQQIYRASVVVVIAGGYVSYSKWLEFEIQSADAYNKPILAIKPFGNVTWPSALNNCKNKQNIHYVNWNSNSFITELKRLL